MVHAWEKTVAELEASLGVPAGKHKKRGLLLMYYKRHPTALRKSPAKAGVSSAQRKAHKGARCYAYSTRKCGVETRKVGSAGRKYCPEYKKTHCIAYRKWTKGSPRKPRGKSPKRSPRKSPRKSPKKSPKSGKKSITIKVE